MTAHWLPSPNALRPEEVWRADDHNTYMVVFRGDQLPAGAPRPWFIFLNEYRIGEAATPADAKAFCERHAQDIPTGFLSRTVSELERIVLYDTTTGQRLAVITARPRSAGQTRLCVQAQPTIGIQTPRAQGNSQH